MSKAKEAFNRLRQAFTKVPILQNFDLECYIWIETKASGYTIRRVLSQLTQNQVTSDKTNGSNIDWYLVAYFFRKMIFTKT